MGPCRDVHQRDDTPRIYTDKMTLKHYELMLQMAFAKKDPVVLQWINEAWREVKE